MKALIIDDRVRALVDPAQFTVLRDNMKLVDVPSHVTTGWVYRNGQFKAPTPSGAADQLPENYTNAQLAKQRLTRSDIVMIRCYESGLVAPEDWIVYRVTLRQMVALEKDDTTPPIPLPPEPPLPDGLR